MPTDLSPRARLLLPVLVCLLAAVSAHRYCSTPERTVVTFEGATMGTTWTVKIARKDLSRTEEQSTARRIAATLARVDDSMSTWNPESELSRFNRDGGGAPFRVSAETLQVFEIAREVSELSDGAFDVTAGPFIAAWGFGAEASEREPPPASELDALRARVGFRNLEIHRNSSAIEKNAPDVVCDLSAIAKGFAVDEVARALSAEGHRDFLIEVGGELRARGAHLDGAPWRVAIETPASARRSIHRIVALRDLAMATSGDYRNYYEVAGQRFSHTIDPRTARPISHSLASVTVIHPEAAHADALATALNVLGPEEGYRLAETHGIAAYFILRRDPSAGEGEETGFDVRMTKSFEPMLVDEP